MTVTRDVEVRVRNFPPEVPKNPREWSQWWQQALRVVTASSELDSNELLSVLSPQTALETQAEVTPQNLSFPEFNLRRYGGSVEAEDNTQAFNDLIKLALANGGGVCVIPPGTYKVSESIIQTLTAAPPAPNSLSSGLILRAYGAVMDFSGSGYALDFVSPNTSPEFYAPWLFIEGLNIRCTAEAEGGIRINDISSARLTDVFVHGASNGSAFTLRNSVSWCENNRFVGVGAVNCRRGLTFEVDGGFDSFARTYVNHFFGAGITEYWFLINEGCTVYDSQFEHISGNFGSLAYFAVAGDMSSSVIYGIHAEVNASQPSQGVIRLLNYPQNSGVVRRPILVNLGSLATFNGTSNFPVWTDGAGVLISGPEQSQRQSLGIDLIARGEAPSVLPGQVSFGGETSPTATAGSLGALPATVGGYLIINIGGQNYKIPCYLP